MKLTEEQKAEVYKYIFPVPRYFETFNEVYDHVINALEDKDEPYSEDLIDYVVNNDFAGYYQILEDEKLYQKRLIKKYTGLFRKEMLNTFKWPNLMINLLIMALFMVFYKFGNQNFNIKLLVVFCTLIMVSTCIFGLTKSWLNLRKFSKDSIINSFWRNESVFGITVLNLFLNVALNKANFFGLANEGRLIAALIMFFFCNVFARAYIKFYNQKIKVLSA